MRKILRLFRHILKLTLKKKGNIITFLLLPILGVLAALAFNSDTEVKTTVGVYDESQSYLSIDLINAIDQNDSFSVVNLNNRNYTSQLQNGQLDTVLELPADFEDQLLTGTLDPLNIYSVKGETVTIWIQNYLNFYVDNLVSIGKIANTKDEYKTIYEGYKGQKLSIDHINVTDKTKNKGVTKSSIGFLLVFMLMASKVTTDYVIGDKRRRTYTRIFGAKVSKGQYILANILANMVVFAFQLAVILILSLYVFKLNFYMPLGLLIILFLAFGIAAISFGAIIAAFAKSTSQSSQLYNILIVPTSMLAGCFWPIELMPDAFQKFALILPQTWVLRAVDVIQYGGGLEKVLPHIGVILLFAVVLFTLAVMKMRSDDDAMSLL